AFPTRSRGSSSGEGFPATFTCFGPSTSNPLRLILDDGASILLFQNSGIGIDSTSCKKVAEGMPDQPETIPPALLAVRLHSPIPLSSSEPVEDKLKDIEVAQL